MADDNQNDEGENGRRAGPELLDPYGRDAKRRIEEDAPHKSPYNPISWVGWSWAWFSRQKLSDRIAAASVVVALGSLLALFVSLSILNDTLRATKVAAEAAKTSADSARQDLILSSRPWLKAHVSIASPLTFAPGKPGQIVLNVMLQNIGNSVALDVFSRTRVFADTPAKIQVAKFEWCEVLRRRDEMDTLNGSILFPDDVFPTREHTDIEAEEIARGLRMTPIPGRISMFVLTCIDYRFSFSKEHHQTHLVFKLIEPPKPDGAFMAFFAPEGTLDTLVLLPWLEGSSAD